MLLTLGSVAKIMSSRRHTLASSTLAYELLVGGLPSTPSTSKNATGSLPGQRKEDDSLWGGQWQ